MDQSPLVNQLIESGSQFLSEFEKIDPIAVAYWLKNKESSWRLYVASPKFSEGFGTGFSDVNQVVAKMKGVYFDSSYVRLERTDDPMPRFMLDFQRKYPGRMVPVDDVPTFFGVEVDGVFSGESMFHRVPNASKLALLFLVEHLASLGATWMDIQMMTPHMQVLGATLMGRDAFLDRIEREHRRGLRLF